MFIKTFFFATLFLISIHTYATTYTITSNGINYTVDMDTYRAVVTGVTTTSTSVSIPSTIPVYSGITYVGTARVEEVSSSAFYGKTTIKSISLSSGLMTIGNNAFQNCTALTSISIPYTVTEIGAGAFLNCSSLESLCLPTSLKIINNRTFEGCSSLKAIAIPEAVTEIGSSAFKDCSSLEKITIPKNITEISDYTFYNCASLNEVSLHDNIQSLGDYSFTNCSSLTELALPEKLQNLGDYSLAWTGLTKILLLENISDIGYNSLSNNNLTSVYCYADNVPNAQLYSFNQGKINQDTLFVHEGSYLAYKNTSPWNKFGFIKTIETGKIPGQCESPTIEIKSGKFYFSCETPGAKYHYSIQPETCVYPSEVDNGVAFPSSTKYKITCYAIADGYYQSDSVSKEIEIKTGDIDGDGQIGVNDVSHLVQQLLNK